MLFLLLLRLMGTMLLFEVDAIVGGDGVDVVAVVLFVCVGISVCLLLFLLLSLPMLRLLSRFLLLV